VIETFAANFDGLTGSVNYPNATGLAGFDSTDKGQRQRQAIGQRPDFAASRSRNRKDQLVVIAAG
jgi:hypothetical protein